MAQYEQLTIFRKTFDLSMEGQYNQKVISCQFPVILVSKTLQYFETVVMLSLLPQVEVSGRDDGIRWYPLPQIRFQRRYFLK